jgi:hypothetical protein
MTPGHALVVTLLFPAWSSPLMLTAKDAGLSCKAALSITGAQITIL